MKTVNVSASEILNANILIVDEYDANAIPLKRLLNNSGYRNVSFTEEFHDVIHLNRKFRYDLLLVNVQMNGVDGAAMIKGLQNIEREGLLPALLVIGQSTDVLRGLPAGEKDFIRKPFDMLEVKTRIHNMLVMRFLDRKIENYNSAMEVVIQERIAESRENEERLRSLVELSVDWYWEQDRHGKFTRISGPVFEMLGLEGTRKAEGHGESQPHWIKRQREQLDLNISAKRPFTDFAYSLISPDGSHRYLRVSGEPIFDSTGCFSGYRGVGVDVSECISIEEKLMRFRKISGDIEDAIIFASGKDMHLLDANDAAIELCGYTRHELMGLNFESIVSHTHGVHLGAIAYCNPAERSGQQKIHSIQIKHKDGSFLSAEMLCLHSKRSREKNLFVIFIHRI